LKSELPLYAPGRPKRELKHKFPQSSYKSSYKGDIVPRGSHLKVQVSPIHSQEAKPHTNTQVRDKSSTKGNRHSRLLHTSFALVHRQSQNAPQQGSMALSSQGILSMTPIKMSQCDIGEVSMRSQETRLRRKRSHMPCNLVNFIFGEPGIRGLAGTAEGGRGEKTRQEKRKSKVGKTPAGEEKKCGGRGSVTTTTDSTMSSDVQSAQSLCRRGGPGEGGAQQ